MNQETIKIGASEQWLTLLALTKGCNGTQHAVALNRALDFWAIASSTFGWWTKNSRYGFVM